MEYYFADGSQQRGPFALEQLSSQGLKEDTLVWHDGMAEWKPAREVPELAGMFSPQAVTVTPVSVSKVVPAAGRSPLAYQAPFGATGHTNGLAIASLVLGIIGLVTMVCYFIGIIPGILAIIFARLASKQIAISGGEGRGIAKAGLICGSIAVGVPVLIFVVLVIFFMASNH